ncbi:hypothetical protein [Microbulbifer elongatus]|uniref:hypothetical protein n=1 Tax=Microbulbifer elongatus TaxID=86173 RepID=UPI001E594D2B|nr:hypothetical protein [Microbulbifer elongatus]
MKILVVIVILIAMFTSGCVVTDSRLAMSLSEETASRLGKNGYAEIASEYGFELSDRLNASSWKYCNKDLPLSVTREIEECPKKLAGISINLGCRTYMFPSYLGLNWSI